MTVQTQENFASRLQTLGRKHKSMTHGYTTKVGKDGLLIVKPKRARRLRRSLSLQALFLAIVGFFAFKAFMLAAVGPITYNERLDKLNSGTVIEQGGAWGMGIDPVTQYLAQMAGPVMRDN